jgi:hypothetical protein
MLPCPRRIGAWRHDIVVPKEMTSSRISDGIGKGIGKVERLKGKLMGWPSRRIAQEHRLVYRVSST